MKMNVSFKTGEIVNGWKIITTMGCSRYIAKKDNISICFDTEAGAGRNYSKILWYTDNAKNRTYHAMRYLFKYVSPVQGLSNQLYMRYNNQQNFETV